MKAKEKTIEESKSSANRLLAAGASAGALGTAGALITGAVCPLCVIATPVLVGAGLVKRLKLGRKQKAALSEVIP
jgi:hypothetical protein